MPADKAKCGAPRKTPQGGKNYTFYLSREVGEKVREFGGARWITRQVAEEEKKNNK